jgi:murein L,D-transpeptidase YafK
MLPDALIYPGDRPGHILVADKANQMLYLYNHDGDGNITLERVMPCSTGKSMGDKMVEGDKKTPNGFYIFNQKFLPRELAPMYGTLAYPTDYPNFWDRHLGRGGYGIWLHGTDKPLVDNDSNGCIALENADIAQLEDLLKLYDTILITYEDLTLAPVEELRRENQAIKDFLEDWRRAWSGKDHAAYRAKYAPDFVNSDKRGFEDWMTHKENVASNYQDIRVELKNLRIYRHRDVIVAAFEQDYQGDQRFTSVGLKRLYLRPEEGGGYRIIGEKFRQMPPVEQRKRLTAQEKRLALTTPPKVAPPVDSEPEDRRAAMEARAVVEDQARSGGAAAALSEEGLTVEVAEARGSLVAPPAPAPEPMATAPAAPAPESAPLEPETPEPAPPAIAPSEPAPPEPAPMAEPPAKRTETEPPRTRAAEEHRAFAELIGQWARAWTLKDKEAYFAFYHPEFHYRVTDMGLDAFKVYRSELMEAAGVLKVLVSDFEVQNLSGGRVRVAFRQDYRSDRLRDLGRKILVFKKDGPDWKILSETWRSY